MLYSQIDEIFRGIRNSTSYTSILSKLTLPVFLRSSLVLLGRKLVYLLYKCMKIYSSFHWSSNEPNNITSFKNVIFQF